MVREHFLYKAASAAGLIGIGWGLNGCAMAGGPGAAPSNSSSTLPSTLTAQGQSNGKNNDQHCEDELRQAGREVEMALDRLEGINCSCGGLRQRAIEELKEAYQTIQDAIKFEETHEGGEKSP